MNLKNNFTEETRLLFIYCHSCFHCGKNPIELHHIMGRESSSALNAIPLCPTCHLKYGIDKNKKAPFLQKTIKYLLSQHYNFTAPDIAFYQQYRRLYLKDIKTP
jgi:5-methylcytosine-specific restriction endonuclease McrA